MILTFYKKIYLVKKYHNTASSSFGSGFFSSSKSQKPTNVNSSLFQTSTTGFFFNLF